MDQTAIETDLKWIREKLKKLDKIEQILGGNGGLGLVGRVTVLWHGHVWVAALAGTVIGGSAVHFLT